MSWYNSLSAPITKGLELFQSVIDVISKSKLDVTEKERLLSQIEHAKINFELESMKLRLNTDWMKYIAFGSGILLGLMIINNYIVLPYFPAVKALEIPIYLWLVFGVSIGADKLFDVVNKVEQEKKEENNQLSQKTQEKKKNE